MKTKIFADKNLAVGKIDRNLFGSFLEHLGRAVYGGIYEPTHPTADKDGFRGDVLELVKELNVPLVRYPGGNFVSGYDWKDGVGPKDKRPVRLDLAWFTTEPNTFGTDEFMKWCKAANVQPMLAVNMGTGSVRDAAQFVEYCNHEGGTTLSEYRRSNGANSPYGVKYWCIGNEMDGSWQIGHLTAEEYGRKALEAAKVMRWANGEMEKTKDPLRLVVSGSSNCEMDSFPEWDRVVLENTYPEIDYLSMHRYYEFDKTTPRPLEDFLASADDMHRFIGTLRATLHYVRAKLRSKREVYLSFDEWNVWTQKAKRTEPVWKRAPHLLEDVYTFQDTLVVAGMMNTLLNNCDAVKIGCLAQLVNVIAPIMTEDGGGVYRQASFYPFRYLSNFARGVTLRTFSESDTFDSMRGTARSLNEAVCYDEESGTVCVSLVNYSQETKEAELELRSLGTLVPKTYVEMTNADLFAVNSFSAPETVVPHEKDLPAAGEKISLSLPAMSWSFLVFETKNK